MGIATDPLPGAPAEGSWPAALDAGIAVPANHQLNFAATETQQHAEPRAARLGVIASLRSEVDCLPHLRDDDAPLIFVSGGSALRARGGAEGLRDSGAIALVSFGMAVGLAPVLRPGDIVLADSVVLPGGRCIATDPSWRAAVLQHLAGSGVNLRVARLAGSDELPTSARAKRRMFQTTFAAALDTDTHAVAEVAAAAGLPLLVVRAVNEATEDTRPAAAFAASDADGRPRRLAVASQLARRPWEIPAAWRFSTNSRLALESLRRVASIEPGPFALGRI